MFDTQIIDGKEKLERITQRLIGGYRLPHFLFDEVKNMRVAVALKKGGAYAGLAYGIIARGRSIFFLHFIYVAKEHRTRETVLNLLEAVIKAATDAQSIEQVIWKYDLNENETDKRAVLVSAIPFCSVEKADVWRQIRVKTEGFDILKKLKWYQPQRWSEIGYDVIKWADRDCDITGMIRERETGEKPESDYLSPFIEDEDKDWVSDDKTSFLLIHKDTRRPAGWVMCQRYSQAEVKIRRFYTYAEERPSLVALSFIVYVLEQIAASYQYLYFDIVKGNRQMEKFTKHWFTPAIDINCVKCNLYIKINKEEF